MARVPLAGASLTLVLLAVAPPALGQDGARRDDEVPEEEEAPPKLTRPPELVEAAPPDYPPEAAKEGLEAGVKVRLHIDAEGNVTEVEVVEPAGHGFDEAAVEAAEQYKFEPAEWDGEPGPIVVETTIHFTIEEVEEPEPVPDPEPDWLDAVPEGPPSHGGDPRFPVDVEGVALERGTRKELAGVIVSIAELGMDAVTDEEGRFYFHGVPPGSYKILAVADDYDRFDRSLDLAEDQEVSVKLYLRAKGGNPYETVVEGEREALEVTRRTVHRRQMLTVPGTFGDPIRVVQSLPGLARSPFNTGFLVIRGSNPDDSGIFIDGHRVPQLFHFLGGPSILNAEFLEKLDLYPGGFPARYGRSIGGVVSVETRPSKSDGVHGSADVDLLDAGGYVRFPVGDNASVALAGRRSYLDFMLGFFLPDQDPGERLVVVPVYYDYQARFDYDLDSEGHASLFVIGSSDQLDVLSEDPEDEEFFNLNTRVDFMRVIGSYKRPVSGDLELTLSPAFGRDSITFGSGQTDSQAFFTAFKAEQDTLSYRMRLHGELGEHFLLDSGVDIESRVVSYEALVPFDANVRQNFEREIEPVKIERNTDMLLYGVYTDLAIDVGKFRFIPGLRLDAHLLAGENRLSADPRLVTRWRFHPDWVGKSYVGLFTQPPQPEAFDELFGNPNLGLERALHTGLGAEWSFADRWSADAEVYFIDRYDLVEFVEEDADSDLNEVDRVNFDNLGSGDTVGLELLLRREITDNLYGWLSYTLSRTRVRDEPDDDFRPSFWDQRHVLNAVASYRLDSGWEIGGRYRLATGGPRTAVVGGTFDADANEYRPVEGDFFGARRKDFHQLDVRVEKSWVFKTWMLALYFDVLNVFDIDNEEAVQHDYRYRERAPVTSVPIVPTLGIRGRF